MAQPYHKYDILQVNSFGKVQMLKVDNDLIGRVVQISQVQEDELVAALKHVKQTTKKHLNNPLWPAYLKIKPQPFLVFV